MARQSAWRATQIAAQRITAKSHRKTPISATGCAMISTNWLPAEKNIAAVPKAIASTNSLRTTLREHEALVVCRLRCVIADIGATISSSSWLCNWLMMIQSPRLPLTAGYGGDDQKWFGTAGNRVWYGS